MDHFGIGAAMRGMVEVYLMTARQTGRTTSLLDSLRDGDRVVCLPGHEAARLRDLCAERGLKVRVTSVPVHKVGDLFHEGTSEGRTIFDHTWVEALYLSRLEDAERNIDYLQRELSGYGEAHRETARAYKEAARWRANPLPPLPRP